MLLLAAAIIASPGLPSTAPAQQPGCARTTIHHAMQQGRPPQPRKLVELPPANAYAAVYRRVDGCEIPVVVRYGLGR